MKELLNLIERESEISDKHTLAINSYNWNVNATFYLFRDLARVELFTFNQPARFCSCGC